MDNIKLTAKYWRMVLRNAIHIAWRHSNVKGFVRALLSSTVVLIVLLLLSAYGRLPEFLQLLVDDFGGETRTAFIYVLVVGLLAIAHLMIAVVYVPAMLHDEQEARQDQLKLEINSCQEETKPKLKLSYDIHHKSSRQITTKPDGRFVTVLRIRVSNISSKESVENISIMLREINHPSFTFLPAELGVMNNQEKRLNAGASLFAEVRTHLKIPSR